MNEGQQHFVFFVIDPNTLKQEFYCSLHGRLNLRRIHVSKCLHNWIKHQHSIRMGANHPRRVKWSANRVNDDPRSLGNSHQGVTVDCALHTSVVPILLADGMPIGVFGTNNDEAEMAGIEMRRRLALMIHREEFMFEPRKPDDIIVRTQIQMGLCFQKL